MICMLAIILHATATGFCRKRNFSSKKTVVVNGVGCSTDDLCLLYNKGLVVGELFSTVTEGMLLLCYDAS